MGPWATTAFPGAFATTRCLLVEIPVERVFGSVVVCCCLVITFLLVLCGVPKKRYDMFEY